MLVFFFSFCQISPVEKVAVLCRFLDIGAVTKNHLLKYALAHAFCCFLASVEDVNPAVATRARLLLDTIKRPALQVICATLESRNATCLSMYQGCIHAKVRACVHSAGTVFVHGLPV